MKRALITIAAVTPMLSGCHAVMYGNLAVLAIVVGIFMGTLSLGRD
ncbi:MAG: hypothetical protein OXT09_10005 [Myxococcales bacterium]|nr:hypothetical protein [Myxococcales bacterium]